MTAEGAAEKHGRTLPWSRGEGKKRYGVVPKAWGPLPQRWGALPQQLGVLP